MLPPLPLTPEPHRQACCCPRHRQMKEDERPESWPIMTMMMMMMMKESRSMIVGVAPLPSSDHRRMQKDERARLVADLAAAAAGAVLAGRMIVVHATAECSGKKGQSRGQS